MCNKDSKVFTILDSMGFMVKAQHRKIMQSVFRVCLELGFSLTYQNKVEKT